ncbi:3-hydroxyisobutyrate dehydrogenase-like beta-hydroxyacid dehydrogenase [Catenuloplanes atrovinosus]|uniref:3-hydroxyisobutyrate dehydrogenase-like beta-hydroxyacid dehydrogenase n=2 Tax=Catenuloplanes atrovinosus TaxID=137266 RepID=A0AAE3YP85_9ACTN|nr:3-hydroxyisobutyrate dehydrogenase-like beta-hydroxyacid dehydrogenase [Catenuloplanes atrovinosus]
MASTASPAGTAVGFIGLGDQGLPMAVAIAEAGFALHVWARRAASTEALRDTPATVHRSPAELAAACDIVAVCVSTDEDLLRLLTNGTDGSDGLLAGARPGTIVVNHGTGTPQSSRHLAEVCAAAGAVYVDAPVSGGRPGAEARTLTVFAGGPDEALKRCRPVLAAFATNVVPMGPVGAGQTAKLFNNVLLILNQATIGEVVKLASAAGADPDRLVEALRLGSGTSRALTLLGEMVNPDTVQHLSAVEDLDVDLFAAAMDEAGLDAGAVVARAHEGARGLPALVGSLPRTAAGPRAAS